MKNLDLENNIKQFKERIHEQILKAFHPFSVQIPYGKQYRSELIYLFGKNYQLSDSKIDTAAFTVEGIHAGSLLIDDLIDEDLFRRGAKTLWNLKGKKNTISLGFLLFSRCMLAFHRQFPQLSSFILKSMEKMSLGESQTLSNKNYISINQKKTGTLFILSCLLPALIRGTSLDELKAIYFFSRHLGISYQIQDDIQDKDLSIDLKIIQNLFDYHLKKTVDYFKKLNLKSDAAKQISCTLNQIFSCDFF